MEASSDVEPRRHDPPSGHPSPKRSSSCLRRRYRRPKGVRWAKLSADVTVIFAGESKVHNSSRAADAVGKALPNARTVVLTGCSHQMLPMLSAGELDAVLLSALH